MTPDVSKAQMFAEIAHAGQTYNDEVPYTFHLQSVVRVLERFGVTHPTMLCAAWLHDSIEDTNRSYGDIEKRFGRHVAELVFAVTSELGRNRHERNAKTYPKIKADIDATILKLADRIANVEYGAANGGKNDMYAREFLGFFNGCFEQDIKVTDDNCRLNMWKHVARLLGYTIAYGDDIQAWVLMSNKPFNGVRESV